MLLLPFNAGAQVQKCDYDTYLTAKNSVVIDANTGAVLSSNTRFSSYRERLDLYFVNKNPFGFTYEFEVKGSSIEAGVISAALTTLGFLTDEEDKVKDEAEEATAAKRILPVAASPVPTACDIIVAGANKLRETRETSLEDAKNSLAEFNKDVKQYDDLLKEIIPAIPDGKTACSTLATKAQDAVNKANGLADHLDVIRGSRKRIADQASSLNRAMSSATTGSCSTQIQNAIKAIEESKPSLDELDAALKEADAKRMSLETNNKLLSTELARADALITKYPVGPMSEPTALSIKVARISRADKSRNTVAASAAVQLGVSRFSLSAGAAFGFSDQKNFVRQSSVTDSGIVNIVGVDEESDAQVGVVGQLNGRIVGNDWGSLLWSLGASMTQGEDDTQFGIFTGPTLGLIDDQLFITAAYHLRKEKKLSGGFSEGDVVPADLQGEIPTREKTTGALLISVTYKIR